MVRIRKVVYKDKDAINYFFDSLSEESNRYFNATGRNRKAMNSYFNRQISDFVPFMAEIENKAAGLLFLYKLNMSVCWLSVCVADEFQGKGIGKLLMKFAKRYAVSNNKGGILLTTHTDNKKAQSLYEKSGYERLGISEGEYLYLLSFEVKNGGF